MTITSTYDTVLVAHSLSSFYELKNLRNKKKLKWKSRENSVPNPHPCTQYPI